MRDVIIEVHDVEPDVVAQLRARTRGPVDDDEKARAVSCVVFPEDPAALRRRIRSHERKLDAEKRTFGRWEDGYGKRFLVGTLYMMLGDVDGALAFYAKKEAEVPDDSPEPYDHLSWALALHRAGKQREAFTKLYQCDLSNLYLVPVLLGEPRRRMRIWGAGDAEPEYAEDAPPALLGLWTPEDRAWARTVYDDKEVARLREQYIKLMRELVTLPPGPKRNAVVREASKLERRTF